MRLFKTCTHAEIDALRLITHIIRHLQSSTFQNDEKFQEIVSGIRKSVMLSDASNLQKIIAKYDLVENTINEDSFDNILNYTVFLVITVHKNPNFFKIECNNEKYIEVVAQICGLLHEQDENTNWVKHLSEHF
jgi:hypothetical protein